MNIEWNSEEVNQEYPLNWNKGPYVYQFSPTEELMIEKARAKYLEQKSEEPITMRERFAKNFFRGEKTDRMPMLSTGTHSSMPRIFDSFATAPSTLSMRDMINHPNLDTIGQMLWLVKWAPIADTIFPYNYGFGEELVTRKFRFIESGPPLAVEPFVKTKEDAQFFIENVPDPALRAGTWPIYFWETKQLNKILPEAPIWGSCCGGPVTMAGFLRGIKDFVMDIRNNMEMAQLCLKGTTMLLKKKVNRMAEILGQQIDDTGEGNFICWCDSTSYLSSEEFARVFDITYGDVVPWCAKKGWAPEVFPEGPITAHARIDKILSENLGGGILAFTEHPTIEEWYGEIRKYDNLWVHDGFDSTAMLSPDYQNAINKDFERHRNVIDKYPTKGLRTMVSQPGGDATIPLPALEFAGKLLLEKFKME